MKKVLVGIVVVAAVVSLGVTLKKKVEGQREYQELSAMGDRLRLLRSAADSCRNQLAVAEARFRDFDKAVDSLRREVRSFEELDPRGVPQERYDEYMSHFDGYNDSVARWEERARSLEASEAACREVIEEHNTLSDSLRTRLDAAR